MDSTRKLWIGLGTLLTVSFGILLLVGGEIYRKAPPMPSGRHRPRAPGWSSV